MTQSFTLIRELKESTPLLEFSYGSQKVFVTLSKSPVTWQGNRYIPEPAIEVKLPSQGFSLEQEACVVTLPLTRAIHPGVLNMAVALASLRAAPKVEVRIINLLKASEDEMTPCYLFDGVLEKRKRNPSGKRGVIELDFQTELHANLEDISLGRRSDPECDFIFGDIGCYVQGKDQLFAGAGPYFKQVRRAKVTISFSSARNSREVFLFLHLPSHPGVTTQQPILNQPQDWWVRGIVSGDDIQIPIQEWRWDATTGLPLHTFILNRIPPLSWETPGKVLDLIPDCARTSKACNDRGALSTGVFGGTGFGIPSYNPTFEVPDRG